jgi:hypothetical protein
MYRAKMLSDLLTIKYRFKPYLNQNKCANNEGYPLTIGTFILALPLPVIIRYNTALNPL